MTVSKPRLAWLKGLIAKHADGDLQAFSEKVDIDRSTISLLYHGKRTVTDKYAIRISNRLHVSAPEDMKLNVLPDPPRVATEGSQNGDSVAAELSRLNQSISGLLAANVMLAAKVEEALKRLVPPQEP